MDVKFPGIFLHEKILRPGKNLLYVIKCMSQKMTSDRALGFKGLKDLIDFYETLDKQELIDRLTLKNAQLLSAEKEIDRLNEYVQIMELQDQTKKT